MSDNPLYDGTLSVTIGGQNVTAALLPGLGYSNTNPGGFGEAPIRLPAASPFGPYSGPVVKDAPVVITHGAQTLFEGEVTNDISHAIVEGGTAYYDVTAAGLWWEAGQRGDFCHVWGDDDAGQWFERNTKGGIFQTDTDGKVEVRFEEGQTAKNGSMKSLYYWLDSGMGDPDAEITFIIGLVEGQVLDKDAAHWHADLSASTSPWGTWTIEETWDNETITAGTIFVKAVSLNQAKALRLRLYVDNGASTGTTADRYIRLSKFSITTGAMQGVAVTNIAVGNPSVLTSVGHGLQTGDRIFIWDSSTTPDTRGWQTVTRTGADTFTIPVNVSSGDPNETQIFRGKRLDEVLSTIAVTTGLATTEDSDPVGVGNWGLNVRDEVSRAGAIETIAATSATLFDYGFWESATWHCHARVAAAGTHDILIDSSTPGIDCAVFKNSEESPTHVKVLYAFRDVVGGASVYPEGTLLAVYRPSAPTWGDASVVLDVWDQWADMSLETGQANAIGDQILAWLDANAYEGTVTIATPTVPLRGGGTKLTAYIRAGDYIEDANLATGPLMITSMEMDVDSGVATLGIGETRAEFVARIEPRVKKAKKKPYRHNPWDTYIY